MAITIDPVMVQQVVFFVFCVAGVVAYTLGRYQWKKGTYKNINEFLASLDIDVIVKDLKFDNLFLKTAGVAVIVSAVVVALSYQELLTEIDPTENLFVTALKGFAIGAFINLGLNTLIKGNSIAGVIQSIIAALAVSGATTQPQGKEEVVEKLLQNKNFTVVRPSTLKTPLEMSEENRKINQRELKDDKDIV